MNLEDTPEWQLGEVAVRCVRRVLMSRGFYLLPTDQIDMGGAPGFIGPNGLVKVPDLLAAARGRARWVEVKWKTSCVLHQRTRTWRHGIDTPLWRHYLKIQNLTSIQGWLAIVQLRPGPLARPDPVLLMAPFDLLDAKASPHDGGGDEKVWWDVSEFSCYRVEVGDDWQTVDVGPRLVRPWERTSKAGDAPRVALRPRGAA
jgi:hypothetical protein